MQAYFGSKNMKDDVNYCYDNDVRVKKHFAPDLMSGLGGKKNGADKRWKYGSHCMQYAQNGNRIYI